MKFVISLLITLSSSWAIANTIYFSCAVKEPIGNRKKIDVTVKFAIQNFDPFERKGDLIEYPGLNEDSDDYTGMISVTPKEYPNKKHYAMMTNLNGQGGDLRITENRDIHLFGDGDGYQFTDLVLWDDNDEDTAFTQGYVRDYGPSWGSEPGFKQFISCKKSENIL